MKPCRLTSKYQTTVPADIRDYLGLKQGDAILFEIRNGQVIILKAVPLDIAYAAALSPTLEEWNSENDEAAYGNL